MTRWGLEHPRLAAFALSAALPVLLLHPEHVPLLLSAGTLDIRVSDVAIVVVVILSLLSFSDAEARRAAYRWLWLTPFLALLLGLAVSGPDPGPVSTSVLKLVEYAGLGLAMTLAFKDSRSIRLAVTSLIATAAFFGLVAAVELLRVRRPGVRIDSLIGADSLGLLGAAILIISIAATSISPSRSTRLVAASIGLLCFLVAASISAALGLGLAVVFAAVRRIGPFQRMTTTAAIGCLIAAVALGAALVGYRWSDFRAAIEQTSGSPANPRPGGSFMQRAMFADFGVRMWLDHPILGVGFRQSADFEQWSPYLASVRSDFPALPASYFPRVPGISFGAPGAESNSGTGFGLHSIYSQLPAETGLVGTVLFAVALVGLAGPAFRHARESATACIGALLIILVLGSYTRNELYGGLPETTILVLALAFAARGGGPQHDRSQRPSLLAARRIVEHAVAISTLRVRRCVL